MNTANFVTIKKKSIKHNADQLSLLINPEDTKSNPLTWERLMDWLASTGWVYGYVRKRISPMDAHLYEDYAQECWCQILKVNPERMLNIWYTGKGLFVNFIKRIIDIQIRSKNTKTFLENKLFHHTHVTIDDSQWKLLENGERSAKWVDTYPVKCECTSGNRKKMIRLEYEELPFDVASNYQLIDIQKNHA